jgi:mannosyl-3-phosphoglycerate synthase
MQVIYHSPICPPPLKKEILREAKKREYINRGTMAKPQYFPPLVSIDPDAFLGDIQDTPYGQLILDGIGEANGCRA